MLLFAACGKEKMKEALPDGSVAIQQVAGKDTIEVNVSVDKDIPVVINLTAILLGEKSVDDHWITFGVDTTKIADYSLKYGDTPLLPSSSYLFHKPITLMPAGATVSQPAEFNIGAQTKLEQSSTYVLPLVVKAVDGDIDAAATDRVVYVVVKTSASTLIVNREEWTIKDFSSQATNLGPPGHQAFKTFDDDNLTTFWATSNVQQMPQWVTINFNKVESFKALTYYIPPKMAYPTLGGYPTSIKIETSMNGTNWVNKGVFAGKIANNMQTINLGSTTAKFLRFTCLSSVKFQNVVETIWISGITLPK
ncbi:discoidin domain-containing protein [Pedobacter endophyticus]|uniref:Discoidin domain-containing protein n=1 Tax=Pedobacter endophyticus TaxID=2789740 RepID=A0A7S9L3R7_9SPHI|nr:discoidin domain-containing protein [Pedobacter endophyticus]